MSLIPIGTNTTQNSPNTNTINSNPQGPHVGTSFVNEQLKTALKSVAEGMTNNHINFEKAHSVSLRHNTSNQGFWGKIKQVFLNVIHSLQSLSRNPDRAIHTLQEQSNAIDQLYHSIYNGCIRRPDDTMTFNSFNELFDGRKAPVGVRKEINDAVHNIRTRCENLKEEAKHFKTATKDRITQGVDQLLHNLDRLQNLRKHCEVFSSTANDLSHLPQYHGLNDHKDDPQFFQNTFLKDLGNYLDQKMPQLPKGTLQVS